MRRFGSIVLLFVAATVALGSDLVVYRVMKTGEKGLYEAKCKYPVFQSSEPVAAMANAEIKKWAASQQNAFLKECKDYFKQFKEKPEAPWEQTIDGEAVTHNSKIISVRIRVNTFTGGAHPVFEDTVFNYAVVNGKAKRLTLDDLFVDRAASRKHVHSLLIKKLKATGNAQWLEDGTVTSLEPAQLNRFVVGRSALTFLFNPYEVGPWAVGNFEIPLTFKELGPKFKKGLLGG